MSSKKSTSPEAAQKKVWMAEIRVHQKAARKVAQDFNAEERRLARDLTKSMKARMAAAQKLEKFQTARSKKEPRALATIERRIAILKGRIGI